MDEFFAWQPGADYNDPFCIANAPLAQRFTNTDTSCDAEAAQYPGVLPCFDYPGGASPQPVQGTSDFNIYNFYFWQYIDVFVYFNGTEQLGQIVRPPVFWVNAGHRNGVPVLGNLFFQGQDTAKLAQLVAQDKSGGYPGADQLIAIAKYYGFDGWFLNPEVDGGTPSLATQVSNFLVYIEQKKFPGFLMAYYDSMISDGTLGYQTQLDSENQMFFQTASGQRASDLFFADYGWKSTNLKTSNINANAYQRCPYEVYSGIDLQGQEYAVDPSLQMIKPDGQSPYTSIAFYGTPFTFWDNKGKYTQPVYAAREIEFWVGPMGNANEPPAQGWKGIAYYVSPRSVIASCPFVTRFNTAQGQSFYLEGTQAQAATGLFGNWSNISQEDILPTWQNWLQNATLTAGFSYDTAYDGGTSLKFQGSVEGGQQNLFPLFSTQLEIKEGTHVGLRFMSPNGANPFLSIAITVQGVDGPTYFPVDAPNSSGWTTADIDLSGDNGDVMTQIGLLIAPPEGTPSTDYLLYLGEFYVLTEPVSVPNAPNPAITAQNINGQTASLNVSWASPSQPVWYWNLFDLTDPSQPVFLGRSFALVFNVANLAYPASGSVSIVGVQAVALDGGTSDYGSVKFDWTSAAAVRSMN